MSIEKIRKLIMEICDLQDKEFHMRKSNKYKCEHYDTYHEEYDKVRSDLINARISFVDECNKFVNYPKQKFLFIDTTKKIMFKEESYVGLLLSVPFIDKKEYFCLINLFENMSSYMYTFSRDNTEWMFK